METTGRLARFIAESRFSRLPAAAIVNARAAVLDCLGVAVAGSADDAARICSALVLAEAGSQETSLYGLGGKAPALAAAFANGTAAHAADFDHSFVIGGQPTAPIIPATLALAEATGAGGKRALEAYITGFEVTAVLAFALRDSPGGGWHANGVLGAFGATAACCRLLDLDEACCATALALTASMASGVSANFGTMTKPLHVGLAARNGVLAAKLAAAGFSANPAALEAPNGFFSAYYRVSAPDDAAFESLGKTYAMEKYGVRFKPYPCGGLTHTAIFATIELRNQHGLTAEMVDSVDVDVPAGTYNTIAFRRPETALQGKFCMGYLVSRALIDGRITLSTFTEAAVRDAGVLSLLERVVMRSDPALTSGHDGSRPARVTIRLRDGRILTRDERFPKGGPEVPITQEELHAKFRDCCTPVLGAAATERAAALIHNLEDLGDVGELTSLLRG